MHPAVSFILTNALSSFHIFISNSNYPLTPINLSPPLIYFPKIPTTSLFSIYSSHHTRSRKTFTRNPLYPATLTNKTFPPNLKSLLVQHHTPNSQSRYFTSPLPINLLFIAHSPTTTPLSPNVAQSSQPFTPLPSHALSTLYQ